MPDSKLVGSYGPERDLDEQQLAEMRPAIESAPRPRKPSILREVTKGIQCFCGERFGEHQALAFMLHLRAEVGEDLAVLEGHRRRNREERRRISADPVRAAHRRERDRKRHQRLMADPEYRARARATENARRADPQIRQKRAEQERERRARKKAEREAQAMELADSAAGHGSPL